MRPRAGNHLRRRIRSLAILELLNIPLQAAIWFGVIGFPVTPANGIGFALFALLLLEGAGYWLAKLRQTTTSRLPGHRAFRIARVVNVPLLLGGVGYLTWVVIADPGTDTVPGLGFALFALLEHINYFHTQLMYDNVQELQHLFRRGLRPAHLARDLERTA